MIVLAGDLGGTHCRLSICDVDGNQVTRGPEVVQQSAAFGSLVEVVRAFLSDHRAEIQTACFGLPGPVRGRRAVLTNLPWTVDADALERELGLSKVTLLNDLAANAHGLATLSPSDFSILREGTVDPEGNAALVSPGTGLGQAGLHRLEGRTIPFATEGGHVDFAPSCELEITLLRWLMARHGPHISWERVVSGPGLVNLYHFLRDNNPQPEPPWLTEALRDGHGGTAITRAAIDQTSELCMQATDLFMALFGAKAGNVALATLATGGVYLGGGIAPNLATLLPASPFITRFEQKGRLRDVLEHIPLRIVLNDKAALQGAALMAAQHAVP